MKKTEEDFCISLGIFRSLRKYNDVGVEVPRIGRDLQQKRYLRWNRKRKLLQVKVGARGGWSTIGYQHSLESAARFVEYFVDSGRLVKIG